MIWWDSPKVTSRSESPSGSNSGRSTSSWKGRRHEIGECSFILWTYLVAESYEQNGRIRDLLRRPLQEEIDGVERAVKLHIELEEELFPKARQVLEDEDFERIGDLIEHCKWQVRGLAQARLASSSSFLPAPMAATPLE
jgi:hypothetical protein